MFRCRCHLPTPGQPGSLYLVTLLLRSNCAPFQAKCMEESLGMWQRLFTVEVVFWHLCDMGATLLVYVPNSRLGKEEAASRNTDFDAWILERRGGRKGRRPRKHGFDAGQLSDLSKFMTLFAPDLTRRHRELPPPADLLPGYSRIPVYRRRYGSVAVQHDALPPVFAPEQLAVIRQRLKALGFGKPAETCPDGQLCMSRHGLGTLGFLADLETRCLLHLRSQGKRPRLWQRYVRKYMTPVAWEVMDRRIGELQVREPHEDYPGVWSLLAGLDSLADTLRNPTAFAREVMMPRQSRENLMMACLPLTLTLLLTDGLLRWYYRERKGVEFPYYNFYRQLQPWEVPRKPRK